MSEKNGGPIPLRWHARLRHGVRARVHASVEAGHTVIPLDLVVHAQMQDRNDVAISVEFEDQDPVSDEARDGIAALTPRELGVIQVVAMGKDTAEIAQMLHISPATVRTHVRNAMAKVGAHTRAQLIAIVLGGAAHGYRSQPRHEEAA
jgi:DNA-binding NarL/FixJ family response regulator